MTRLAYYRSSFVPINNRGSSWQPSPYYVALPIDRDTDGELCPGEPVEALNAWQAKSRAAGLAIHHPGAVAFSRTGDPASGEFEPAIVLARHGELPADIEAMMAGGN